MPLNQNIMKLLGTLGGGSASYAQGSMPRKNGQPVLQKPALSQPDVMSPYAPGLQGGGTSAWQGAAQGLMQGKISHGDNFRNPNSTVGVKQSEMVDSPTHPISQLAEYLTTTGGASASAANRTRARVSTDPAMFIRGGASV
jgi:hypothetical protein